MFEELKKKIMKSSLAGSVILLLAGLGLAGWNAPEAFYSITGYVDFTTLAPEQIKSQLVEVDLADNVGCYLEEQERNTKTNVTKTTDLYYVIWTGDDYAIDWRYMSIKVPASYESKMDAMFENTYNGLISTPISFCGKIKKLDDEEYRYFKEYCLDIGMTEEEFDEFTLPYYIDCFNSKISMSSMYIALFALGAVLLI